MIGQTIRVKYSNHSSEPLPYRHNEKNAADIMGTDSVFSFKRTGLWLFCRDNKIFVIGLKLFNDLMSIACSKHAGADSKTHDRLLCQVQRTHS